MDYEECVALISAAEAADTTQKVISADVYDLGSSVAINRYDDKKVEETMAFIERSSASASQPQGQAAQPQVPGGMRSSPSAGVAQAKKQGEAVAKELGSLLSKTGTEFSKHVKKTATQPAPQKAQQPMPTVQQVQQKAPQAAPTPSQPAQQKLVLVSLSLQDQITELDKINTMLDSKIFNDSQLQIVKLEINGLMKNKITPSDDFQKGLVAMRDSRLKEIAGKLGL